MQLDMAVAIEPGGLEARTRGLEFGMLGEADTGTAFYTLAIFENRYVKQNGIWRSVYVPCVQFPETSMKNHGYLLPPS
jgi:hypothetical protein